MPAFEVLKAFEDPGRQPSTALVLGGDGALYGTTAGTADGPYNGTVFKVDSAGTFSPLHVFSYADGAVPSALVRGSDGALYGTTQYGGSSSAGTIFKIDTAGNFSSLHSFSGVDGASPSAALVLGRDGALYGTTQYTIFRIDSAGSFSSLHSFNTTDGAEHFTPLVLGSDGALYGTSGHGSSSDYSSVFKIDSAGTFTSLHSFNGTDGAGYVAPLVLGSDDALYGTTSGGGFLSNAGTVFRIDGAGGFTSLHSFNYTDGELPGPLVQGRDGALYGTTSADVTYLSNAGTVFKIDSAGTFTTLHSFAGTDGNWHPAPPLVQGSDGALYGATSAGGSSNAGTIFKIDSAGSFTSLHSFVATDGAGPVAPLVVGSDGAFYGTTSGGGSSYGGTVFKIDSTGSFTSLHSFVATDGFEPVAPLVLARNGGLYGTTSRGGPSDAGTVFEIDSAGTFTSLHSFSELDGSRPSTALVQGSDSALYGTTYLGGRGSEGAVFRIDTAGSFSHLLSYGASFYQSNLRGGYDGTLATGSDGAVYGTSPAIRNPFGGSGAGHIFRIDGGGGWRTLLVFEGTFGFGFLENFGFFAPRLLGSDGAVYGTTDWNEPAFAGTGTGGAAFKIDSAGTFTLLHSFDSADLRIAPLVMGSDGAFYGTTSGGGSSGRGTIFKIDREGMFTSLHSFSGTDGTGPAVALVLGTDGAFYGTTTSGGSFDAGAFFKIDSDGTFTSLHSFNRATFGIEGRPLVLGGDGAFYGTTQYGDSSYNPNGTVFRIDSAGNFSSLHSFNGTDGASPSSALVVGSDCALYGTASNGGPGGGGVVFRLFEPGHLCQRIRFDALADRTLGDSPFTVSATSSSGLPISFSASGSCSVTGDQVSITGVGICTVTASQAGDSNYEPAPDVSPDFNVTYDFTGFFSPVENPPVFNHMTAGRAVPIRFELGGDAGLDVIAEGYPVVRRVSCDASAPLGEFEPARTAGSISLRYRPATGRYTYIWKTDKHWAESCREFTLKLVDGTEHRANFRFKRIHAFDEHHGGK